MSTDLLEIMSIRGGAWLYESHMMTSRGGSTKDNKGQGLGFRLVRHVGVMSQLVDVTAHTEDALGTDHGGGSTV